MRISKASFAAGAAAALVLGSGTAFAATGGNFLLGKANTASAVTTLYLKSKTGTPSLVVNSKSKVANLNADYLDNKDISAFALSTGQTGTIEGAGQYFDLDGDGTVDTIAAFADCPTGTVMTGGGGVDQTAGGTLWYSAANGPNGWAVASSSTPDVNANPDPSSLILADVQCYNPKGAVPGALARKAPASPKDSLKAALARKAH
jgi:hypothetical protein